jgi:hypothetical protein
MQPSNEGGGRCPRILQPAAKATSGLLCGTRAFYRENVVALISRCSIIEEVLV